MSGQLCGSESEVCVSDLRYSGGPAAPVTLARGVSVLHLLAPSTGTYGRDPTKHPTDDPGHGHVVSPQPARRILRERLRLELAPVDKGRRRRVNMSRLRRGC